MPSSTAIVAALSAFLTALASRLGDSAGKCSGGSAEERRLLRELSQKCSLVQPSVDRSASYGDLLRLLDSIDDILIAVSEHSICVSGGNLYQLVFRLLLLAIRNHADSEDDADDDDESTASGVLGGLALLALLQLLQKLETDMNELAGKEKASKERAAELSNARAGTAELRRTVEQLEQEALRARSQREELEQQRNSLEDELETRTREAYFRNVRHNTLNLDQESKRSYFSS